MNQKTFITIAVIAAVGLGGYYVWKKTKAGAVVPAPLPQNNSSANGVGGTSNGTDVGAIVQSAGDALHTIAGVFS